MNSPFTKHSDFLLVSSWIPTCHSNSCLFHKRRSNGVWCQIRGKWLWQSVMLHQAAPMLASFCFTESTPEKTKSTSFSCSFILTCSPTQASAHTHTHARAVTLAQMKLEQNEFDVPFLFHPNQEEVEIFENISPEALQGEYFRVDGGLLGGGDASPFHPQISLISMFLGNPKVVSFCWVKELDLRRRKPTKLPLILLPLRKMTKISLGVDKVSTIYAVLYILCIRSIHTKCIARNRT